MMAQQGKDETDKMFAQVGQTLGLEKCAAAVAGTLAAGIVAHTWMFGYIPGKDFAAMTNHGLPLVKVLMHGEIHVYVCNLNLLRAACEAIDQERLTADTLEARLLRLDAEKIKQLIDAGCAFHAVKVEAGNGLYIPNGSIVVDCANPSRCSSTACARASA